MKASILFGSGWENDSVEVLWRDPGRLFCRLWRNDAQGEKHAFVPILSEAGHPILENVNRLAHEFELREQLDSTYRPCVRWSSVRDPRSDDAALSSITGGSRSDRLTCQPMEIRSISLPVRSCFVRGSPP